MAKRTAAELPLISKDELMTRLGQLAEEWQTHHDDDLELRWRTGEALNAHFGPPNNRQQRGQKVMKTAAKKLSISEGVLSRLRWFAHTFRSVQELKEKHPKVRTWTDARNLLPKPTKRRGKEAPPEVAQQFLLALRNVRDNLSEEKRKELVEQFRVLAATVEKFLKIRVVIDQAVESSPGGETPTASPPAEKG